MAGQKTIILFHTKKKKKITDDLVPCRNYKEIFSRKKKKKTRPIRESLDKPVKTEICSISSSLKLGLLHFSPRLPPSLSLTPPKLKQKILSKGMPFRRDLHLQPIYILQWKSVSYTKPSVNCNISRKQKSLNPKLF